MMQREEILDLFQKTGVLLEGHFRLTSGRHSGQYLQCAQVLQYPQYTDQLAEELAAAFTGQAIDTVIGPALGGIIIAYEVARKLGTRALFAERENGVMTLRRGFRISPGERVLVVEDVVTTGGSVNEVLEIVAAQQGQVVGVGALVDRSGGRLNFGVPLRALLELEIPSYSPAECPLCQAGLPLVKPGSRAV